jgi:hypothetical protein
MIYRASPDGDVVIEGVTYETFIVDDADAELSADGFSDFATATKAKAKK